MPTISFVISATPIPASRPRVFRNGGRSYSASHVQYAAYLSTVLPQYAPVEPITDAVAVTITFIMPEPKKATSKPHRADLDNLCKILLDEMTKAAFFADDSLVTELHLSKRYAAVGEAAHTAVTVSASEIG